MRQLIHDIEPHLLVTIGLGYGGSGGSIGFWDRRSQGLSNNSVKLSLTQIHRDILDSVDFGCVHQYNMTGGNEQILAFLKAYVGNSKPLFLQEGIYCPLPGAWDPITGILYENKQQEQSEWCRILLEGSYNAGMAGHIGSYIGVSLEDSYGANGEINNWWGQHLVTNDDYKYPAYITVKEIASRIGQPKNITVKPIIFDENAYLTPIDAMEDLFKSRNS